MDAQAALALITLPVQDVCTERSRQLEELFHAGVAHVRQEMTGLRKQQYAARLAGCVALHFLTAALVQGYHLFRWPSIARARGGSRWH